jgi:hypothetical protein
MQQPAGIKLASVIVGRVDKYPTKIRGAIPGFFVSYGVLWKLMRSYKNPLLTLLYEINTKNTVTSKDV